MQGTNLTLLRGHQVEQQRSITIKDKEAVLYAKVDMASLLPPNYSQQACLYVAIDDPALTIDVFEEPISVNTRFSAQYTGKNTGPYNFTELLMVRSITRLPHKFPRTSDLSPLYAYRLDCGYPTLTLPHLACRRTKAYQGTPKAVIEAVLNDSGLESNDINMEQLMGQAFTANEGWYLQNGETTEEFVRHILAENGGILFLNNDNVLCILDSSTGLINASQYEIGATMQNVAANFTKSSDIPVKFYNFRSTHSTVPVQALNLNSHPLTKTDLRSGVAKYANNTPISTHELYTVHANLPGDALNPLANNLLEADTFADKLYTTTTTVPFTLGDVVTVSVYDEQTKLQTHQLMVVAVNGQHSFEAPITNGSMHPSWTGITNGLINYELTLIDATKLPRMPMPATTVAEIPFNAVIVDKNGKADSKVAPAEKEIFVGLVHGHTREASQFTTENIIPVANHIEPMSFTSSVPAPGTMVRVLYSPTTKSFTLDGRIVIGNYTMNSTIKNDSNAKQASEAGMTFSPNEIGITIGPNNKTTASYSAAGYSFTYESMKFVLDKGVAVEQAAHILFTEPKSVAVKGAGTFTVLSTSPAKINTLTA